MPKLMFLEDVSTLHFIGIQSTDNSGLHWICKNWQA